jgi:SpoVK/Ycf46/Vps4 family AAA+-type ATPase
MESDGFSGASLAGVARAAASHALERSVEDFVRNTDGTSILDSCVVKRRDFSYAIKDVLSSSGTTDWEEK